jgi:tRNA pseudouridine55 synthase
MMGFIPPSGFFFAQFLLYLYTPSVELTLLNNGILPVWQPLGQSTNHMTKLISEKLGVKTAHTGTLDPMAEGVVVVLYGEERLRKIELASWKKTYEFEITFGISTDSFDGLGKIEKIDFKPINEVAVENVINSFKGPYTQKVPIYSAIKYRGKKLFKHANNGTAVLELPEKSGEIFYIELINFQEKFLHQQVEQIITKIRKVEGPLRQEIIINGWENFLKKHKTNEKVTTATIRVENSRGLYVRSLSQDICRALGTVGFVSNLVRTANGIYTRDNCQIFA